MDSKSQACPPKHSDSLPPSYPFPIPSSSPPFPVPPPPVHKAWHSAHFGGHFQGDSGGSNSAKNSAVTGTGPTGSNRVVISQPVQNPAFGTTGTHIFSTITISQAAGGYDPVSVHNDTSSVARSFRLLTRLFSGALNGNVGVLKSVLAELADESNVARAFSFLPLVFVVGQVIGFGLLNIYVFCWRFPIATTRSLFTIAAIFFEGTLGRKTSARSSPQERACPQQQDEEHAEQPLPLRSLLTKPVVISIANYGTLALLEIATSGAHPARLVHGDRARRTRPDPGRHRSVDVRVRLQYAGARHGDRERRVATHRTAARSDICLRYGVQLSRSVRCSCLFLSAAPNKRSLGAMNGLAQTVVSTQRAVGPAAAASLFAFSLQNNILGGQFAYAVLLSFAMLRRAPHKRVSFYAICQKQLTQSHAEHGPIAVEAWPRWEGAGEDTTATGRRRLAGPRTTYTRVTPQGAEEGIRRNHDAEGSNVTLKAESTSKGREKTKVEATFKYEVISREVEADKGHMAAIKGAQSIQNSFGLSLRAGLTTSRKTTTTLNRAQHRKAYYYKCSYFGKQASYEFLGSSERRSRDDASGTAAVMLIYVALPLAYATVT
ncbi:hypothetical protein EDB85DRAFT_2273557 [Lactarius pseudohatsudake]|nr:hypothetical protein EDB85DRAFT_2273557 [Lactarius pseudohatsudake]